MHEALELVQLPVQAVLVEGPQSPLAMEAAMIMAKSMALKKVYEEANDHIVAGVPAVTIVLAGLTNILETIHDINHQYEDQANGATEEAPVREVSLEEALAGFMRAVQGK